MSDWSATPPAIKKDLIEREAAAPTKRYPVELPAQGASDRLCNAGLANPGWSGKAENGSGQLRVELPHSEELQHPLLHRVEGIVVGVQVFSCLLDVY